MPNYDPELTDDIICQDRALVHAIEALGTIKPSGWFERLTAGLLLATNKRRLREIMGVVPSRITENILSASEQIDNKRMALRMNDN